MTVPPSVEDSGSFGAEIPQPGEAGAFYQSGHNLPNGLRINFTFGHIDRMPRCEATGLIVPFCSCSFHSQGFAQPCTDIRGETE